MNLDRIRHITEKIRDIDSYLDFLEKHEVYIRVGHSNYTLNATPFIDPSLMKAIKGNLKINIQLRKEALLRELKGEVAA